MGGAPPPPPPVEYRQVYKALFSMITDKCVYFDYRKKELNYFWCCHTNSQPSLCTVHARSCYAMHRDRVIMASTSISTNLRRTEITAVAILHRYI